MTSIYIEDTGREIVVSRLDCVVARLPALDPVWGEDIVDFLQEVLTTLGHRVES